MIDHYDLHCQMQEDTSRPLLNEIESLRQRLEAANAEIAQLRLARDMLYSECCEKDAEIERITHERNNLKALLHARNTGVAASQLREQQFRDALGICLKEIESWCDEVGYERFNHPKVNSAIAIKSDTSALEAMIAKAGECMRERCADFVQFQWDEAGAAYEIRALPGVTLGDVK